MAAAEALAPAAGAMLVLPAQLTMREARDALRMLVQSQRRDAQGPLRVDASALQQFDTSAIAVLLECRRIAQAAGRGFELRGAPPKLTQLAALYGVAELLGLSAAR